MKIQKIISYNFYKNNKKTEKNERFDQTNNQQETKSYTTTPFYNNIAFEARVDKGLVRFYETNAERMPKTVKTYIESLVDKTSKTPLQAQASAFAGLIGLTSVLAIKEKFPEEDLFQELKEPSESKATRGILGIYRQNKELLELCQKDILANGENLTTWLVKKIYLDGKTIDEINTDFMNESDEDFLSLYRESNDTQAIRPSTLKALGIKMPEFEYQQSLRYTRNGYADYVGEKISQSLKEFLESMPIEERTARARKSVERFEKWWTSIPRDQQLEMIARQTSELEMLEQFNASKIGKTSKSYTNKTNYHTKASKENQSKIETSLSRDDLFKLWATNNLKKAEANLTEYDKRILNIKREQIRSEWWANMSPAEKTEYINRLKSGAEPLKFAMIDAWNNNADILIELSYSLKRNHAKKPLDLVYGTSEFNENFSNAMTEFWKANPDYAEKLGKSITKSHNKIKEAIKNGQFEQLKKDIMKARSQREQEIAIHIENYREIINKDIYDNYPEHVKDFINAYVKRLGNSINAMPKGYMLDFFNTVEQEFSVDTVKSWIKAVRQETLTPTDLKNLDTIKETESNSAKIMNRAAEATLAEVLYHCTKDPRVFFFSQADCKMALMQIFNNREKITIHSNKNNVSFEIDILNREYNSSDIDKLYETYKAPISEKEISSDIENFFSYKSLGNISTEQKYKEYIALKDYMQSYRSSLRIIFNVSNEKTKYPTDVRNMFLQKFIANSPIDLKQGNLKIIINNENSFKIEDKIKSICDKIEKRLSFLPYMITAGYIYEICRELRVSQIPVDILEEYEKIIDDKENFDTLLKFDRKCTPHLRIMNTLASEQAIADVLFEATGDEKVYAMELETLIGTLEKLMKVRKFPSSPIKVKINSLNITTTLSAKKRVFLQNIKELYNDYIKEMFEYKDECDAENKPYEDEQYLLILNPDENAKLIDTYTMLRIKSRDHLVN